MGNKPELLQLRVPLQTACQEARLSSQEICCYIFRLLVGLLELLFIFPPFALNKAFTLMPYLMNDLHCLVCNHYVINSHLSHLADSFIQSVLQQLTSTFTHRWWSQPCKATASSSGAIRVGCLAQGHLDTHEGGAILCHLLMLFSVSNSADGW